MSNKHRLRLLEGMAAAVARSGYPAVTIAGVVAEAGVSKRTFYEHFAGKEDCLLACYLEATGTLMTTLRQPGGALATPGPDQIESLLDSYLGFLDRAPHLASTLLIEVQRSGAEGRRVYRQHNEELAVLVQDRIGTDEFDRQLAIALVGGMNELLLRHAEDQPGVPFRSVSPTVLRFARATAVGRASAVAFADTAPAGPPAR